MANHSAVETTLISQNCRFFFDLGTLLQQSKNQYESFLRTHDLNHIRQAVRHAQKILDLVSPYDASSIQVILGTVVPQDLSYMVPMIVYNLAKPLLRRFQRKRQAEDITKAIQMFQWALFQLMKNRNEVVARDCFWHLNLCYAERDGNLRGFPELMASARELQTWSLISGVRLMGRERILDLCNRIIEEFNMHMDEMFTYFVSRVFSIERLSFRRSMKSLEILIPLCRQALDFFSHGDAKGFALLQLSSCLNSRFCETCKLENIEDINEAASCSLVGLQMLSPISPWHGPCLLCASNARLHRFRMLRRQDDLDDAHRYARQAGEVIHLRDPAFIEYSMTLASVMQESYYVTGDVNDSDAAIDALSRAIDINRANRLRPDLDSVLLSELAGFFHKRARWTGKSEDISEAIRLAQTALEVMLPEDPLRSTLLTRLSTDEILQYSHLLDGEYLKRAVRHVREAWSISQAEPLSHDQETIRSLVATAVEAASRNNHGVLEQEFLDNAIEATRNVTLALGAHHPMAGSVQGMLCYYLVQRWEKTPHEIKYIDEAISTAHRMIKFSQGKGDKSVRARTELGGFLHHRYKSIGDSKDREEALTVLLDAFEILEGLPGSRMRAGQLAVDILCEKDAWGRAHELSRQVVDLLEILNGRSLSWEDKQHLLTQYSQRAAQCASISLQAGSPLFDVLDLLERCRGSVLGHLIDSRTDFNELTKADCKLAEHFRVLLAELNSVIDLPENTNSENAHVKQFNRRSEAENELRSCLKEIRTREGFHRFMLGPTQGELKAVAARGPIVIVNVSSIRSDAIIITKDDLVLLPLLELKYQEAKEFLEEDLTDFSLENIAKKNRKYRQLQKWLWERCVKLILEELYELDEKLGQKSDNVTSDPAKNHVWWIGIGIASSLPFHAAGIYTKNADSTETALFRIISSYAPSIKVLINSRRQLELNPADPKVQPRLALFVMRSTCNMPDLDGVEEEASNIQEIVGDIYSPKVFRQLSANDAKKLMEKYQIVHFACHGESTLPNPSKSHLLLQTTTPAVVDKLTLRDVASADLRHGKLAFLSACCTAQDRFGIIWDEGLHLASGFQVAGYLHAIGNLWPSNDEMSVRVVTKFYEHLMAAGDFGNGENVAQALNEALTEIAKMHSNDPLSWAQFVHFGV